MLREGRRPVGCVRPWQPARRLALQEWQAVSRQAGAEPVGARPPFVAGWDDANASVSLRLVDGVLCRTRTRKWRARLCLDLLSVLELWDRRWRSEPYTIVNCNIT